MKSPLAQGSQEYKAPSYPIQTAAGTFNSKHKRLPHPTSKTFLKGATQGNGNGTQVKDGKLALGNQG